MPGPIRIDDLNAPELAVYARLTEAALRRESGGVFIAESVPVIGQAIDAGCEPLSFLAETRHVTGKARSLLARCPGVPVYTGGRAALAALTGYELTRGVLCAMRRPAPLDPERLFGTCRRLCVLEDITDAANVGAIFRCAAALGADAVLLSPGACDPLVRRAVRVSMGAVFKIPWARLRDWPGDLSRLHAAGFRSIALTLRERADGIDSPALRGGKLAVVLGAEGGGLRAETVALCTHAAKIPMRRGVDSLNVAAACAVALWELWAGSERPQPSGPGAPGHSENGC